MLAEITRVDPDMAEIIELHMFDGLNFADIAQCMGVSERTVYRCSEKARALIQLLLEQG